MYSRLAGSLARRLASGRGPHLAPAFDGDAEDDAGDDDGDDGVGDRQTQGHQGGAQHDAEAGEAVGARVVAVGDQGRSVQPAAGTQTDSAGTSLPRKPMAPARPSASKCSGACGRMVFSIAKAAATHALMKMASTTARPAEPSFLRGGRCDASG